ncbi:divalent metal cation transporter, partial [bacterium]|nr:divalent metal cation transporter [bacterium]
VYLTSSERVMGKFKNSLISKIILYGLGGIVALLNIALVISFFK